MLQTKISKLQRQLAISEEKRKDAYDHLGDVIQTLTDSIALMEEEEKLTTEVGEQNQFREQNQLISELQERIRALEQQQLELPSQLLHRFRELQPQQFNPDHELQQRLGEMQQRLDEGELERKKLHNKIMELKGNIRVFCRVRPFVSGDGRPQESSMITYHTSIESQGRGLDFFLNGTRESFIFDKVFSHEASQEEVFFEISQLVQSALDGYKVCIFAYGQTGSGKTYTMMGSPEPPELEGLIPRSLKQIFQAIESLSAQGWQYKMQVSMLEIYMEMIRDLLSPNQTSLEIVHDANGNTIVKNLTVSDVCSIAATLSLLQKATNSRSIGQTRMNEQSSRSHFVVTMRISGVNESIEQQVHGVLNLIDLAGSERISQSMATGERLDESKAINSDLSSLNRVIMALANKEDYIPFRISKLTHLLEPYLGRDSKTLMLVTISPVLSSGRESRNTLGFAERVKGCEIGVPRQNTEMKKKKKAKVGFQTPKAAGMSEKRRR